MKTFCLFLFLVPSFIYAQDCNLRKEKDQFSQLPKLTSGFVKFDSSVPFQMAVDATKTDITFFLLLKDATDPKCFDDQSTLVLTFEGNRSKVTLRNAGPMNCDGYFHLNYRNTATTSSALKRLTTQKIATMSFINGKITTTVTLNENHKQQFMNMASCIAKEAPSLLSQ